MIPPCAFAIWLHGLHGEAFEEADFFVFILFLFHQICDSPSLAATSRSGTGESNLIRLAWKTYTDPYHQGGMSPTLG